MIKVYQAKSFRKASGYQFKQFGLKDMYMMLLNDEYEHVANVPGEDLEEAFRLTNSIQKGWYEDKEICIGEKKGYRSTSVGDIMILNNKEIYVVGSFGFDEIDIMGLLTGEGE